MSAIGAYVRLAASSGELSLPAALALFDGRAAEVSEHLGLSEVYVRWWLGRARTLLRSRRPGKPHCSRCGRFCSVVEYTPPGESGDIYACAVCDRVPARSRHVRERSSD